MNNFWNREPVAIVNAVRLIVLAAMAFGLNITMVQLVAAMTALEAVLTLFTRAQVTSADGLQKIAPATLQAAQETAPPVADVVKKLP